MAEAEIQKKRAGLVLPRSFYERNTLQVARDLLGRVLVAKSPEGVAAGRIVETEAYRADDPASHSCRGQTPRSAIMFGPPGVAYVYFIYGMHEMLNFVTEPQGQAGAVLIRALEPGSGEELMLQRRSACRKSDAARARSFNPLELASGPGKICRALGITLAHNGASLRGPDLKVVDDGFRPGPISVSPRVGITQGTEKLWRFFLTDHPCVSRAPQNAQATLLDLRGAAP